MLLLWKWSGVQKNDIAIFPFFAQLEQMTLHDFYWFSASYLDWKRFMKIVKNTVETGTVDHATFMEMDLVAWKYLHKLHFLYLMGLLLTETCSKKFRLTEISMLHQKLFHPIACHLVQDFWENLHTRNYSPLLLNMLWESLEIWPFFFIHIHMNPITTNIKGYRNSSWLKPIKSRYNWIESNLS